MLVQYMSIFRAQRKDFADGYPPTRDQRAGGLVKLIRRHHDHRVQTVKLSHTSLERQERRQVECVSQENYPSLLLVGRHGRWENRGLGDLPVFANADDGRLMELLPSEDTERICKYEIQCGRYSERNE